MDHQDFQRIRKEYEDQGIDVHDLDDSPFKQTEIDGSNEANDHSPGHWFETNAIGTSYWGQLGIGKCAPSYLLKGVNDNGIRFFTNYDSLKGPATCGKP